MPAINIEDLSEKDKLKMEVEQLRKEVKLERQPVSGRREGAPGPRRAEGRARSGSSPFPPGGGAGRGRQPGAAGAAGCGSRSSGQPRPLGTAAVCTDGSCRHFGSGAGAGAVGTALLTALGAPVLPGGAREPGERSAPRGWHGPARRGPSRGIWHPLVPSPRAPGAQGRHKAALPGAGGARRTLFPCSAGRRRWDVLVLGEVLPWEAGRALSRHCTLPWPGAPLPVLGIPRRRAGARAPPGRALTTQPGAIGTFGHLR